MSLALQLHKTMVMVVTGDSADTVFSYDIALRKG